MAPCCCCPGQRGCQGGPQGGGALGQGCGAKASAHPLWGRQGDAGGGFKVAETQDATCWGVGDTHALGCWAQHGEAHRPRVGWEF